MCANIIIQALILSALIWCGCHSEQEVTSTPPEPANLPDHESWNSTITTTTDGVVTSKIQYVHMQRFSGKRLMQLSEGVEIDFFNEKGKHIFNVTSESAVLYEATKRVELTGSVEVEGEDGLRLSTEKLLWDELRDKITSDESITVVTAENDTIHGVGFESDRFLQNWTIKKPSGVTRQSLKPDDENSASDNGR